MLVIHVSNFQTSAKNYRNLYHFGTGPFLQCGILATPEFPRLYAFLTHIKNDAVAIYRATNPTREVEFSGAFSAKRKYGDVRASHLLAARIAAGLN